MYTGDKALVPSTFGPLPSERNLRFLKPRGSSLWLRANAYLIGLCAEFSHGAVPGYESTWIALQERKTSPVGQFARYSTILVYASANADKALGLLE